MENSKTHGLLTSGTPPKHSRQESQTYSSMVIEKTGKDEERKSIFKSKSISGLQEKHSRLNSMSKKLKDKSSPENIIMDCTDDYGMLCQTYDRGCPRSEKKHTPANLETKLHSRTSTNNSISGHASPKVTQKRTAYRRGATPNLTSGKTKPDHQMTLRGKGGSLSISA